MVLGTYEYQRLLAGEALLLRRLVASWTEWRRRRAAERILRRADDGR
jgi:hypothetical protein